MENRNNKECEVLFESSIELSDYNSFKKIQNIYFKAVGIKKLVIIEVIQAIAAAASLALHNMTWLMTFVILLILIPLETVLVRKTAIKKAYKNENVLYKGKKRISFTDDKILCDTDSSHTEYSYDIITNVISSKEYYIFLIGRILIAADKSRFAKGTKKEFEQFIADKFSNIKIKTII